MLSFWYYICHYMYYPLGCKQSKQYTDSDKSQEKISMCDIRNKNFSIPGQIILRRTLIIERIS